MTLIIVLVFIASLFLKDAMLHVNYSFGSRLFVTMFWGAIACSGIHSVVIITKNQLRYKAIWLCVTALPLLYISVMMILGID